MSRFLAAALPLGLGARHLHSSPVMWKYFDKILVANRGEIACRVFKTTKELGIKSVAVYSDPDRFSVHTGMADESVNVGPAASSESYLNIPKIIKACEDTGAQAVHPGYGFLSENHAFVEELEKRNLVFIGPPASAIEAMGDKISSKKLAKSANVNTIPGYVGEVDTNEEVIRIAREIGYPVMIKASAGGGGKGMRIAWTDEEAVEGFRLSKEEAKSSFGDDRMFIEKFIEDPRHIEIQIIADSHGNVVYLPERECSIQRRNQKVVEEAPSVAIDRDTWHKMGQQAAALARAVGYRSAGTCEFLVDKHMGFYFLEMNTRLQVEHPVTEMVTGIDLVEQMIRVAAGKPLSVKQEDVKSNGWAIESRVYAEDPFRNFLPSVGRLMQYQEPSGDGVRCDSGIRQGSEISINYDPMISKLVTWGKDREEAIDRMSDALDSYVIRGLRHNITFLRTVMDHERFRAGRLTTAFIQEEYPEGFQGKILSAQEMDSAVLAGVALHMSRLAQDVLMPGQQVDYKRPTDSEMSLSVRVRGGQDIKSDDPEKPPVYPEYSLTASISGDEVKVSLPNGKTRALRVESDPRAPLFKFHADGDDATTQVQLLQLRPTTYTVQVHGAELQIDVRSARQAELEKLMPYKPPVDTSKMLLAPMPGKIVSLAVAEGDHVEDGQELAVLEAMKMQNILRSGTKGVVKKVHFAAGATIPADAVIMEME